MKRFVASLLKSANFLIVLNILIRLPFFGGVVDTMKHVNFSDENALSGISAAEHSQIHASAITDNDDECESECDDDEECDC